MVSAITGPFSPWVSCTKVPGEALPTTVRPMLSDWSNLEKWVEDGSKDTVQRANALWKQLLQEYEQPSLDPGVEEELMSYIEMRKADIAAA